VSESGGPSVAVEQATAKPRRWSRLMAGVKPYGDVVDALLKTLVVIGIFFGSYEYFSRQQSTRVEKSLELVDEWQSAGHRDAWQRINDAIWPKYSENAAAIESMPDGPKGRGMMLANIGDEVTGRDNNFASAIDHDVDQVFYFFDRAALCANERICDFDVINTFLGEEARTFWLYFSRYAERRQAVGYAGYGAWTARFATAQVRRALFGLI
jgi:hypothetical protein